MGIFNKILLKKPKYSMFDLSYDHKLSFKMGNLVPVHIQECIPGDRFNMSSEAMFRMMPMLAPIMHRVDVFMHFFFVPNRILWPNWEKFITGGDDPDVGIPAFPIMNFEDGDPDFQPSTLGDYLGIPTGVDLSSVGANVPVSALPFAAYQRVWFEYYRDQNLIVGDPIELTDGMQAIAQHNELITTRKRAWEHDYFTSCLPWAQKGDAVTFPLDLVGSGPLGYQEVFMENQALNDTYMLGKDGNPFNGGGPVDLTALDNAPGTFFDANSGKEAMYDPNGTLWIDPSDIEGAATINDLRTAFSLQKWLEKNARAGTRYIESILDHFGVRSSDKRLQRPEYLGGSKANMAISEVLQTSSTDATTPQANMAGHGVSISGGKSFNYSCEEHGYILGLLSVRPRTAYYQGLPRHFSKTVDRTQYYWPDFAFLGEQAVLNKEIYVNQASASYNEGTFGYIPRYSEYRYNPSRVSGQMRTSLEFWHMGRKFATPPLLNQSFIEADPTKRIFAVTAPSEDEIVAHIFHRITARRPMPVYGNPGGI